jgi:hypothetical protein
MRTLAGALLWSFAALAFAHGTSTAYLTLQPSADEAVQGVYRIALRDADALLDLDANADAALTWGEVEDRGADLRALVQQNLRFSSESRSCRTNLSGPEYARDGDMSFAAFDLRIACAAPLQVQYTLFSSTDGSHRLAVHDGARAPQLLAPGGTTEIAAGAIGGAGLRGLFVTGVGHILGGPDHLLFLVALLLPAVLVRTNQRWKAVAEVKTALIQVAWIATAFTIAHSITLALASFGIVRVPASMIEPLIALTVLLAALNNLWPVVQRRLAWVAFAFGLVHGFGFAEVLAPLGLAPGALAQALLAFNLGVEGGQLLVVLTCFAALAAARRWTGYPRWVLGAGSALVALIAIGWIFERLFAIPVFIALAAQG